MSDLITTQEHKCEWVYDWGDSYYESRCGMAWLSPECILEENDILYRPKYGGHIIQEEG